MKKHILCFGDSNTHGLCADPKDCEEGGSRFSENERWTCLLQKALGEEYLILEEGLSGRTTVFQDAVNESMAGIDAIYSCMMSHEPVDLLIVMLGTNDTKERLSVNAACIGLGLARLVNKAASISAAWRTKPNVLIIAPPHIGEQYTAETMGKGCAEKSQQLAKHYAAYAKANGWAFLDAQGLAEFNQVDYVHLTKKGHAQLAARLAELVPTLV